MKLSRVLSRWALVLTGFAAITGLAGSCTVKEDRTNCPCFLYIDLHKLPENLRMPNSGLWLDVVAHTGSVVKMETISPSDYSAPDWVIVSVPKGNTLVSAANGRVHMKPALDGRSITLPEGYEADSLYMHSDIVDCTGESARDTVRLHKQWCTLSLVLESPDALRHYDFEIQGTWSGISTADLSAITPQQIDDALSAQESSESNVIGPKRSAWDIARDQYDDATTIYTFPDGRRKTGAEISSKEWRSMPAGTIVEVNAGGIAPENGNEGLLTIGVDGTAAGLAGDAVAAQSTFYFPAGKTYRPGATMSLLEIDALPAGTRMLVGYRVVGPVAAKRPVFALCGVAWNRGDTYYWDPARKTLKAGDEITERSIPKGAMVFVRKD